MFDLTRLSEWYILKNPPTTGGTWTDVNTADSILEYSVDITVTDFTGERFLAWEMTKADRLFEDIENQNLLLPPGGMAVFAITTPAGASGDVGLSIRWGELF